MPFANTQPPLSRRGNGPGVIVITEDTLQNAQVLPHDWALAGFAVAHVTVGRNEAAPVLDASLDTAIDALLELWACSDKTRFGIIAYVSRTNPCIPAILKQRDGIEAVVLFNSGPGETAAAPVPVLEHLPGGADGTPLREDTHAVTYPGSEEFFAVPGHANYDPAAAQLAHARTFSFLKPLLGGPSDEGEGTVGHPALGRGWFPNMKATPQTV
ncbi:hypothetical protein F5X68DRAFT_265963 [Plectosphaerella plurivora]|uniref:Uncharacterized protein n=1 Tax=Plectosphaerella plurivora TaxID=936078 RepID=A0A9P9A5F2_9PEZI|nr:hypothetical protein F5X68DRAFT_265963 [Plectosphaerella plurivora]